MNPYNNDNDTVEESLNSQNEGFDIHCNGKVSSNFSACSSITFDYFALPSSYMNDVSFRSMAGSTVFSEDCKYEQEEYQQHWWKTHQKYRLELDYADDSDLVVPPPPPTVDDEQQPPTPRTSNHRKQLAPASSTYADITGLEITTAVTASGLPTGIDRTNNSCDVGSASETSSEIASVIVDELNSSQEDDEFTCGTIESDTSTSIPLNDDRRRLLLENKEPSIKRFSLDSGCMTILKSNRTGTSPVANNAQFARDEQLIIGDLGDGEPSASSYEDSTLYEVASLDTKREGSAGDDVQPIGDLGDDEPSACSCDDSTLYEVASLDTKRKVLGEIEQCGEQETNRTTLAIARDDDSDRNTKNKQNRVSHHALKGVQDFDDWTGASKWKDEMRGVSRTYDMDSSLVESSFSSPIPTKNERTLLSPRVLDHIQLPIVRHFMP